MNYEMEVVREIWPKDGDGERYEVGPDRDGLKCVEIRWREKDGAISGRMTFPPELAILVGEALMRCAGEVSAS